MGMIAQPQSGLHMCAHEMSVPLTKITQLFLFRFATLLDSSKNGCRLKNGLLQRDLQIFGSKPSVPDNVVGRRNILATLKSAGQKKGIELQKKYSNLGRIDKWASTDDALLAPALNARMTCRKYTARGFKDYADEFSKIEDHVERASKEFWKTMHTYQSQKKSSPSPVKKSRKEKQEDLFLQSAKMFAEPIPGIELIQNVEEVKASCAYGMGPNFAFHVAFRRLCLIKAESKPGGLVPSLRIFDEAKKVSSSFLRALEWADEDHV